MKIAKYKIALAFVDFCIVLCSFILAYLVRFTVDLTDISIERFYRFEELLPFILISFVALFIFEYNKFYKFHIFTHRTEHLKMISKAVFVNLGIFVMVYEFVFHISQKFQSRLFFIYFIVFCFLIMVIVRLFIVRPLFLWWERTGFYRRKIVIYGMGKRGIEVGTILEKSNHWHVVGYVDDNPNRSNPKCLGSFEDLKSLRQRYHINDVMIAIDSIKNEELMQLIDMLHLLDMRVLVDITLYEILDQVQPLEIVDGLPIIQLNFNYNGFYLNITKRVMDIISSFIGLIVLAPFFAILAVIIKLSSRGPVFYAQIRIGKDGKPFHFYKFRSMRVNNCTEEHKQFVTDFIEGKTQGVQKITEDPRITVIGRFIRKTSIDELPQLFNVLCGDMSLVGPRPCLPYEYEVYKDWHKVRFMVKPGCTGIWQVSGRSKVSFEEMVVMDYFYIHNMNPWLDLKLILETIPVMIYAKGGF